MMKFLILVFLFSVVKTGHIFNPFRDPIPKIPNPGAQIKINDRAIDYVVDVGRKILIDKLADLEIPKLNSSLGNGGYVKATELKLKHFNSGIFLHRFEKPNKFHAHVKQAEIKLIGKWDAMYKAPLQLFGISGSGDFAVVAKNLELSVDAELRAVDGEPRITVTKCFSHIGDMGIKIEGKFIGWVLNIFRGVIAKKAKPAIIKEVCKKLESFINEDLSNKLKTFPTKADIGDVLYIDYGLLKNPELHGKSMDIFLKGDVGFLDSENKKPPFEAHKMDTAAISNRMLSIYASEFVLNSLAYSAHVNNVTQYILSASKSNDSEISQMLQMHCTTGICLGTILYEDAKKFPDYQGRLMVYTTERPEVKFLDGKAEFEIKGEAKLSLENLHNMHIPLITLKVYIRGDLFIDITDCSSNRIEGSMKFTKFDANITDNYSSGDLNQGNINFFKGIVSRIMDTKINNMLKKGFPLPLTKGLKLIQPEIILKNHTLILETDVEYMQMF